MPFAVAAVVLASTLIAVWFAAPKLHRFAYWGRPCAGDAIAALATDGWRRESLAVEPGVELQGLVRPPRDPAAAWLLFLPGNAAAVAAAFRPVLDGVAPSSGMGAAFWPWRGFDASSGTPTPAGLLADARAAWQHVTGELGVAAARLELWGYSLGAGVAVQLAAELCRRGTPPRRLVLLSAYDRIAVMRAGTLGRFQGDDVYDALASAAAVTCPVVFVHGEVDSALPIAGARALAAAIAGPVRFVALPGRGHVDYLADLAAMPW